MTLATIRLRRRSSAVLHSAPHGGGNALTPGIALRLTLLLTLAYAAPAAELKQETIDAFNHYIRAAEARLAERVRGPKNFLWLDDSAGRRAHARNGDVVIEPAADGPMTEIPGGLIHDWIGAVFIPGVTLSRTLNLIQDYDRHQQFYQPEVIGSKLLHRDAHDFKVRLRLLKKKVLTVVLNTEHEVRYFPLDPRRAHSRSYSTKIAQVVNAGRRAERELPPGRDDGFLWRLYTYWRFQERDGGVYIECEAVSLTRGIPFGAGWIVKTIVNDLPRESLTATLANTRKALVTAGAPAA